MVLDVVDARSGHLVPGARLAFSNATPATLRMGRQTLRVRLVARGTGPVRVSVTAPGYLPLHAALWPPPARVMATIALPASTPATPASGPTTTAAATITPTTPPRRRGPGLD
jgi:hypothetical protein